MQQLRGGEIDVLPPQAQIDLVDQLEDIGDVTIDVGAGTNWEFITWVTEGTPLEERYVRRAIARAIDRQALVDALIVPIQPDAEPLNSIFYTATAPEYQPNWADVLAYDADEAISILEENGCERGDDGIFVCDGERLEFDYASISGNERRELTFEVLLQQLADVGIELNFDFSEASVLFGTRVWENDFEMASWGLTGRPDPVAAPAQWGCPDEERGTGTQNFTLLCNDEATDLLLEANRTPDPDPRAALVNEADALLAEDLIACRCTSRRTSPPTRTTSSGSGRTRRTPGRPGTPTSGTGQTGREWARRLSGRARHLPAADRHQPRALRSPAAAPR